MCGNRKKLSTSRALLTMIGWALNPPVLLLPILAVSPWVGAAEFAGGTGTPDDPYLIATAGQLVALGEDPNLLDRHFLLISDIDLDPNGPHGRVFDRAVIARFSSPGRLVRERGEPLPDIRNPSKTMFQGTFDGNGHVIRNLTIQSVGHEAVGLFGYLGTEALVLDLGIEGADITVDDPNMEGPPCGSRRGPIVECIYSCDSVGDSLGGILAGFSRGTVFGCVSRGHIYGEGVVGGLIGEHQGNLTACYSEAAVSGPGNAGGLVGMCRGNIITCYAAGLVQAQGQTGGLIACYDQGTVYLSYWDRQRSGQGNSACGRGKSSGQMIEALTYRGWGWPGTWAHRQGVDYPRLVWESTSVDLITHDPETYSGGSGVASDPYRIATAQDLQALAYHPEDFSKHFAMEADIDCNQLGDDAMIPIGSHWIPFCGVFDGKSFCISNLMFRDSAQGMGLFGAIASLDNDLTTVPSYRFEERNCFYSAGTSTTQYTGPVDPHGSRAVVKNLTLTRVDVNGISQVGSLVGCCQGDIVGCSVSGRVRGNDQVGGLVGNLTEGQIVTCSTDAEVRGGGFAGGLIGASWRGRIDASFSRGTVEGLYCVGGLIGYCHDSVIQQCYAQTEVWGKNRVGGFSGYSDTDLIVACYATGAVNFLPDCSIIGDMGGFIGMLREDRLGNRDETRIIACFWDQETSGRNNDLGTPHHAPSGRVLPGTTHGMQTVDTFIDAGWDFDKDWQMCAHDYPRLQWEEIECSEQ